MPTAFSILLAIPGKKTIQPEGSLRNTALLLIKDKFGDVGVSDCLPAVDSLDELRDFLQRHAGTAGKPEVSPLELRDKHTE